MLLHNNICSVTTRIGCCRRLALPFEQSYDRRLRRADDSSPWRVWPPRLSASRKVPPMSQRTPIRHGEILLLPVSAVPFGEADKVTSCIVGHSESGHHHVLESDDVFTQIVAMNGDLFVDLPRDTPLRHQKAHQQHRELIVPAGAWKVVRKTEFDVRSSVAPRRIVAD